MKVATEASLNETPVAAQPPPLYLAWLMWGLGAIFYLLGFYLRVAPAVLADTLMLDFGITAAALGNFSAFYFYSYALMQIPTGILADSWGPRRLLAWGGVLSGIGTLLFALSPTILWAYLSRLLIGGSVAVAFVGLLKLASNWIAPRQFAMMAGVTTLVGVMGAVLAGVPLQLLVAAFGWRPVMVVSAGLLFGIGVIIWLFVRDDPRQRGYASYASIDTPTHRQTLAEAVGSVREIARYRNAQLLFLIPGGIVGPVLTFSGLWGVPFLTTHYHLSDTRAAALCTTLLVAWAVTGPIFGALSDKIGRRKPLYVLGCGLLVLGWGALIFVPGLPFWLLTTLMVAIGAASGCMIISFSYIKESTPPRYAGTAVGVGNMGVMLGPMLLQPAVGWLLDRLWQGELVGDLRVYSFQAYQAGFSLMLAWVVLAFALILFTQETYCRQFVKR